MSANFLMLYSFKSLTDTQVRWLDTLLTENGIEPPNWAKWANERHILFPENGTKLRPIRGPCKTRLVHSHQLNQTIQRTIPTACLGYFEVASA